MFPSLKKTLSTSPFAKSTTMAQEYLFFHSCFQVEHWRLAPTNRNDMISEISNVFWNFSWEHNILQSISALDFQIENRRRNFVSEATGSYDNWSPCLFTAFVAVESEENHGTRFKQTFQVFILETSAGWLRDFTLFRQNTLTKELAITTTSYLRPLQGLDYNAMY